MSNSNPEYAEKNWPAAVVAGGFQTGVVLMRNLARRGVRVHCVDPNPRQPAFSTRYGQAHLCPYPDDQPEQWLEMMIRLSQEIGGRPALIASSDQFVTAIGRHATALEPYYRFCQTSVAVQALLATKERQYHIASELGLSVPRTSFITCIEELKQFSAEARFPCLLKPLHFREWKRLSPDHPLFEQKLITADTAEELEVSYTLAAKINPRVVVQEIIEGPDTAKMVYLSCYNHTGERIASCMVRQVRTDPIYFGSASVVEPMDDAETDAACDHFLKSLNYVGLCEIELKRDTRDARVKMIEANPRYSVTADAATYAGVDLGWAHYLDLLEKPVEPMRPDGRYFRHIVLFRDFSTFRSYLKKGLLTWPELVNSYRGRVYFFDLDLRDWKVSGKTLISLVRLLVGPPLKRLFPFLQRQRKTV